MSEQTGQPVFAFECSIPDVIVGFGGGGAWLEVLADEGWRGYVHPAECHEFKEATR